MNILFICVANSARSQIAEGLANTILGDLAEIKSAGSQPATAIHSQATTVMAEIGIDISGQSPKSISQLPPEFLSRLDIVIALCSEEQCPFIPGKHRFESWALPDPANPALSEIERLELFRKTREQIKLKIERLKELVKT